MAKVICTELQKDGASGPNITLDTSKNVTCENNLQVDGNLTVTGTIPADKLTGALPAISGASLTGVTDTLSFRNLVINGAMKIAQRGASDTSSAQGYTTVDRWQIGWGGADNIVETHQELLTSSDTGPWAKGFRNAYKLVNGNQSSGAGAGDSCVIQYRLEAHDVAGSGWDYTDPNSKITLSFWVKSSVAQAFQCYLRTFDGTDQVYSFSTGSLSANTWTKVTKTIPGNSNIQMDNNTGVGMNITLWQFAGADFTSSVTDESWRAYSGSSRMNANTSTWWTTDDATFHITGVQLEVGDTATDFEHRSYGDELARCQRYYYLIASGAWGTGTASGTTAMHSSTDARVCIDFPVQMRAAPSVVQTADSSATWKFYTGSSNGTATDCDAIESTQNFAMLAFYSVSGSMSAGAAGWFASNKSVARLAVSSEL